MILLTSWDKHPVAGCTYSSHAWKTSFVSFDEVYAAVRSSRLWLDHTTAEAVNHAASEVQEMRESESVPGY